MIEIISGNLFKTFCVQIETSSWCCPEVLYTFFKILASRLLLSNINLVGKFHLFVEMVVQLIVLLLIIGILVATT
jgi:hypothetical protein